MIKEAPIAFTQTETLDRSVPALVEISSEEAQPTFGEQLFQLRKQAKISARLLGIATGMDHATISRAQQGRKINVGNAATLVQRLRPDFEQSLSIIASLSSDENREYINNLFSSPYISSDFPNPSNLGLSTGFTPVEKAREYRRRRSNRSFRLIAEIGGADHSSFSRFFSDKKKNISGAFFISLVRGLGLTREQAVDLFYSFARHKRVKLLTSKPQEVFGEEKKITDKAS